MAVFVEEELELHDSSVDLLVDEAAVLKERKFDQFLGVSHGDLNTNSINSRLEKK